MIIPQILRQQFSETRPILDLVAHDVKQAILGYCEQHGYAFVSRFKSIESTLEKIETGRFESWSSLDDLFGCTVIVPTLSHEAKVIDFCNDAFIVRIKRRGETEKEPDTFRFDSTRLIGRLRTRGSSEGAKEQISFEIQVKTALEHAWAVSTHSLVYKSNRVDWRRQRIASQIKAAVEQLDTLLLAFEGVAEYVDESPCRRMAGHALIAQAIAILSEEGRIPSEVMPKDLSRFSQNVYDLLKSARNKPNLPEVIAFLQRRIRTMAPDEVPRSISLFQFILSLLCDGNLLRGPFKSYSVHVTEEMLLLAPRLADWQPKFKYG